MANRRLAFGFASHDGLVDVPGTDHHVADAAFVLQDAQQRPQGGIIGCRRQLPLDRGGGGPVQAMQEPLNLPLAR